MQSVGLKKVIGLSRGGVRVPGGVRSNRVAVALPLKASRGKKKREMKGSAEEEESSGMMSDIGLGDLEDVMEKASGGSTNPDFVPQDAQGVFEFLGSENVDLAQTLLVEKFGETLYRELGFSKQSETINGRLAMVGFLAGFGAIFTGDVLTQFANAPLPVVLVTLSIITATVIPTVKPEGYIPDGVKSGVMKLYEDAGLSEVFSPKAELINGRAAMVGIFALTLLAVIF